MSQLKTRVTFSDIEGLVAELAHRIRQSGKQYISIFGVPRGGLIPAVMLSHELGIPMSGPYEKTKYLSSSTLVVDDIADTGKTLRNCKLDTATLHYKPQSIIKPTYYGAEVPNEDWIVYPWEREDSAPVQDYLKA